MKNCLQCKEPCTAIRIKSPEDGQDYLVEELCQECIFKLGDSLEPLNNPRYVCRRCNQNVFVLRNKECRDCWQEGKRAIKALPDWVEPIEAPLGWVLVGCTEEEVKKETDYAYNMTPQWYELPN